MKHLLLTLALIVIPAICTAGRWVKIDSQNGSTFYIHTDIKTENGNYLVWIKTTYDSEEARQDVKKQYNTQKSICEHVGQIRMGIRSTRKRRRGMGTSGTLHNRTPRQGSGTITRNDIKTTAEALPVSAVVFLT